MKPFSNLELSAFCGQIALILRSGISSMEGLTIMLEDADSAEEKRFSVLSSKICRRPEVCIRPWKPLKSTLPIC